MKTLADVKRRATPGTRLQVVLQTRRPALAGTTRTIVRTTANYWYFTTDAKGFDDGSELSQPWPKASRMRIIDADTFEYDLPSRGYVIRLRFLAQEG